MIPEELWEANKRYTDGNFKGYTIRKNDFVKLIKQEIEEYKANLLGGQLSGEWQSILLVNALRLLNDKDRNELALSIIERTSPNLIAEACKKNVCAKCKYLGEEGDCCNFCPEIEGIIDLGSLDINKFGCTYFAPSPLDEV